MRNTEEDKCHVAVEDKECAEKRKSQGQNRKIMLWGS